MTNIEKVNDFLTQAKIFYIVTVDGNKPKARPISFKLLENDKLYFGVGTFKDVYRQLKENPNIEIVAMSNGKWIRYDGIAKFVDDENLENKCLDILGNIGKMYRDNNYHMGIFYIDKGHVEIKAVIKTIEEFDV